MQPETSPAGPEAKRARALVPRDAATLIIIDRTGAMPAVLMGRRHADLRFMPGKYVFPGGRLEPSDRLAAAHGCLDGRTAEALAAAVPARSAARGRALALAAIRETYEETGTLIGVPAPGQPARTPNGDAWAAFARRGLLPDLGALRFVGRAITPPQRVRRFDTRFFAVDRAAIAATEDGFVGSDKELTDLRWVPIAEAAELDLPHITAVMLRELENRTRSGFSPALPIPFFREERGSFARYEL